MQKAIPSLSFPLFVVLLLASCTTLGTKSWVTADTRLQIIDAHTHCVFNNTPEKTSKIMQSKEEYLKDWTFLNSPPKIGFCNSPTGSTIPGEHWRAVFHDNAVNVVKLK